MWSSEVPAPMTSRALRPLSVAIIGSGPAGFYTAYRLMDRLPDAMVDMYEKLPVPFGLSRFGVAPDHPEVKNCQDKFDEVAASTRFRFIGNTMVGGASSFANGSGTPGFKPNVVPLQVVRGNYDAVVLAYGAESDKTLAAAATTTTPTGVMSARAFVGWYNGHPEFQHLEPDLTAGEHAVVVGHGNVALDVARVLLAGMVTLRHTDITDRALSVLATSTIRNVRVVGRRGPAQAAFTNKEVRELMTLPGVTYVPPPADVLAPLLDRFQDKTALSRSQKRLLQLLQKKQQEQQQHDDHRRPSFSLDFLLSPSQFIADADNHVQAVEFDRMHLDGDPVNKHTSARPTGQILQVPAAAVFVSVGYQTQPLAGIEHAYNSSGNRLFHDLGKVGSGLYAAGWIKRGPIGVIAETMYDAFETADTVNDNDRRGWDGVQATLGSALNWHVAERELGKSHMLAVL
ncbi:hypothetical protein V1514DRAFT_361502 [Lipomyces japonicus]|uniref:uncharacterized protein n=1 Tax=Lipomyces japonicus TaxID=56871 RepID=UPI0034CD8CD5